MEDYSSVFRNATRSATVWAASPVGLLVRVEVLVTVSCALLAATIVFLSSVRRTSGSGAFRLVVWISLMLCYPAVTYTIGLIQSGSFRNELVVVWACFLIGCADGIFVCSVDQQARTVLNQATQVIYVLLLLVSYISSLELQLQIFLLLLWVLNVAKLGLRLWSLVSAGREARERILTQENWLISKYMVQEHVVRIQDFDPVTMKGYEYVVAGEKDVQEGCGEYRLEVPDEELVTVDKLWQYDVLSKEKLKAKDLCLSFALFKLLRRRLSGYPVHERDDIRTLVFVKSGIAGGSYERMYRVIEVELGFLYDFFYARYQSPNQSLVPETAIFLASVSLSLSILLSPALRRYNKDDHGLFVTTGLDIWLARFVIALFLILELFQYLTVVLSDWHKVRMVCRIVRTEAASRRGPICERLGWLMCRATVTTRYWSNSVGQYSLLHACLEDQLSWLAGMPLHRWIKDQLSRVRTVTHRNLPDTVKIAIHHLLRSEWLSNLKYGDRTLQRNKMLHAFEWCTSGYQHGHIGTILVWHIATTIFHHQHLSASGARAQQQQPDSNREVATILSNYCAYLLFHAPELLTDQMTDQIYETMRLTQALQLRVHQFLKRHGCRSKDDMFQQLARFEQPSQGAGGGGHEIEILQDGINLGRQIFQDMPGEDTVRTWKVLSEMWVEILLSVAPSDNGMIHVQKLGTGGELITHIWALLTHAGVIDKPKKPQYT